jgi:hypothetical protein
MPTTLSRRPVRSQRRRVLPAAAISQAPAAPGATAPVPNVAVRARHSLEAGPAWARCRRRSGSGSGPRDQQGSNGFPSGELQVPMANAIGMCQNACDPGPRKTRQGPSRRRPCRPQTLTTQGRSPPPFRRSPAARRRAEQRERRVHPTGLSRYQRCCVRPTIRTRRWKTCSSGSRKRPASRPGPRRRRGSRNVRRGRTRMPGASSRRSTRTARNLGRGRS